MLFACRTFSADALRGLRRPSHKIQYNSETVTLSKYFNIIETKPWCSQGHVIRKRNNFVCDFFDLPFRTVPSDFPNGKRTDCNNLLRQGSQWPRQNIAKKTSTKIDSNALVHFFQILFFCVNHRPPSVALWIQIHNLQIQPKSIPTKIGTYSDCTMINHHRLLNLIWGSIFHHLQQDRSEQKFDFFKRKSTLKFP